MAAMTDTEFAPAKLNLALHVRARRDDGFHEIETLFAFVDIGDTVSVGPADDLSLTLTGPFANELAGDSDNLVLAAARMLRAETGGTQGAALSLEKRVPVASGIGGGSADAAATLRLLDRFWELDLGFDALMPIAARLGSDVPACLIGETATGRSRGEALTPVESDLAGTPVLLVNPGVALSTAHVFAAWDGRDLGELPDAPPARILEHGRNDLTRAAIGLAPAIGDVLIALARHDPESVRMSGSGATCFATFLDAAARDAATIALARDYPEYWTATCRLT